MPPGNGMALIAVSAWPIGVSPSLTFQIKALNRWQMPMEPTSSRSMERSITIVNCAMNLRRLAVDFIHSAIRKCF